MVLVVPQFAGNKNLASIYAAFLDGFADSSLSAIAIGVRLVTRVKLLRNLPSCRIDMAISCLEGYKD